MLARIVSRASVVSVRKVNHKKTATTTKSARVAAAAAWTKQQVRFVRTAAEDNEHLPEPPTDLKDLPLASLEALTGVPQEHLTRRVVIYRPARNAMQSGNKKTGQWFLQFERSEKRWNNPVMGWISSDDPLHALTVKFPNREAAIRFADAHGFTYDVKDDWLEDITEEGKDAKNYGDRFKYKPEKVDPSAALADF